MHGFGVSFFTFSHYSVRGRAINADRHFCEIFLEYLVFNYFPLVALKERHPCEQHEINKFKFVSRLWLCAQGHFVRNSQWPHEINIQRSNLFDQFNRYHYYSVSGDKDNKCRLFCYSDFSISSNFFLSYWMFALCILLALQICSCFQNPNEFCLWHS